MKNILLLILRPFRRLLFLILIMILFFPMIFFGLLFFKEIDPIDWSFEILCAIGDIDL